MKTSEGFINYISLLIYVSISVSRSYAFFSVKFVKLFFAKIMSILLSFLFTVFLKNFFFKPGAQIYCESKHFWKHVETGKTNSLAL